MFEGHMFDRRVQSPKLFRIRLIAGLMSAAAFT